MSSQIFIAICLFFFLVSFLLFTYGVVLRFNAKKEENIAKSFRIFKVATVVMILSIISITGEILDPVNPNSRYSIKR